MEMYVGGVSTKRVKEVPEEVCGPSFSKASFLRCPAASTRTFGDGGTSSSKPQATPTCSWTIDTRSSG